jgi:hypothetical protein
MNAASAISCMRSIEALKPPSGRPIPWVPCDGDRIGMYWMENPETYVCTEGGDKIHDYKWTLERK